MALATPYLCRMMLAGQTTRRAHHDGCRRTDLPPGGHPGSGSNAAGSVAPQPVTAASDGPATTFLRARGEAMDGRPTGLRRSQAPPALRWPAACPCEGSGGRTRGPAMRHPTASGSGVAGLPERAGQNPMHLYGAGRVPALRAHARGPVRTPCTCTPPASPRRLPRTRTGLPEPYAPIRRLPGPDLAWAREPACPKPMHLYGVCLRARASQNPMHL